MNNNDNDLVRWAREKIKRDSKFKPACNTFIITDGIGATGPTGPQGPATITVGSTTTSEPGTDATVTNVGTDENVVLEFNIPAGATGDVGPTARFNNSSNKIIHNFKQIPFKHKENKSLTCFKFQLIFYISII